MKENDKKIDSTYSSAFYNDAAQPQFEPCFMTRSELIKHHADGHVVSFEALESKNDVGSLCYSIRVTLFKAAGSIGSLTFLLVSDQQKILSYSNLKQLCLYLKYCGIPMLPKSLKTVPHFSLL